MHDWSKLYCARGARMQLIWPAGGDIWSGAHMAWQAARTHGRGPIGNGSKWRGRYAAGVGQDVSRHTSDQFRLFWYFRSNEC